MDDFGDFYIDDAAFSESAGHNAITEAYAKVFASIERLAVEGKQAADAGLSKEIMLKIKILNNKVTQLNSLMELNPVVTTPSGSKYNMFGGNGPMPGASKSAIDPLTALFGGAQPQDDTVTEMDESELMTKIQQIIDDNTTVSFSDASAYYAKNNNNVEDDGTDHGDIGDINW